MHIRTRAAVLLFVSATANVVASAQHSSLATQPAEGSVYLDVVVTSKSGPPVSGLQKQDFTILDNKVPQTIDSFQALRGNEVPIEVILVIDDVNTGAEHVSYERSELDKFLHADGGRLAHPTALAFITDSGIRMQRDFSNDGNALSAAMDQYPIGLHSILRSGAFWSAVERFQISLDALIQLAAREAPRPGRKIIVWISPGWPLLSSPGVEAQLEAEQRQQIFENVVSLANLMQQGRITLYSIDPLGSTESLDRAFYWEAFAKGISKPSQAEYGDMALQVIATQSGGLALTTGNDITLFLKQCLADTQAYYEISFVPSLNERRGEYHHLEVRVAKGGMVARTRQGYYSQP